MRGQSRPASASSSRCLTRKLQLKMILFLIVGIGLATFCILVQLLVVVTPNNNSGNLAKVPFPPKKSKCAKKNESTITTNSNIDNRTTLLFADPFPECRDNIQYKITVQSNQALCCGQIFLPMTPQNAPECWPRVFLTPSFPTGGSELIRRMFEQLTGLYTLHAYDFIGPHVLHFPTATSSANNPTTNNNTESFPFLIGTYEKDHNDGCQLELPFEGRAALLKTHAGLNVTKHAIYKNMFTNHKHNKKFSGILRLARNPGDQLFRNTLRWMKTTEIAQIIYNASRTGSSALHAAKEELGDTITKRMCLLLASHSKITEWKNFHIFWQHLDNTLPQWTWHYERGTQRVTAAQSYHKLLAFVSETIKTTATRGNTLERIVSNIVKEPTYKQGTLLADFCGVDAAKKVHKRTKSISEALGYVFDETTGYWSLSSPS